MKSHHSRVPGLKARLKAGLMGMTVRIAIRPERT